MAWVSCIIKFVHQRIVAPNRDKYTDLWFNFTYSRCQDPHSSCLCAPILIKAIADGPIAYYFINNQYHQPII